MFQCLQRPLRCPHLRAQSFCSSAAQRSPLRGVRNQFHERKRKLRWTNHTNRIANLKQAHNVPEILGMVAHHDGNSVQRGLDYIESAARNKAAADKCNISERIECSQFANRIDQQNASDDGVSAPQRASPETNTKLAKHFGNLVKALRKPGAEDDWRECSQKLVAGAVPRPRPCFRKQGPGRLPLAETRFANWR